jgi:arylsulfatase A-like enzyme
MYVLSNTHRWGAMRVPFIVRWPGRVPEGVEVDTLFSTVDVYPTLAALAGVHDSYVALFTC